ncbi:MAG: coenzyme F430 synthase [Halobacteriota archaeon]
MQRSTMTRKRRMNIKEASRILVLDPIHGADVIADELKELGKDVTVSNPYREQSSFNRLDYDLVIAPVHLSPKFEIVKQALEKNIPFMSHQEAVKEIAVTNGLFADINVIEVTGTVGKTSVCELICQLLKGKKVLSHTSSSTRFNSTVGVIRFPRHSGTPASVLNVMRKVAEKNLEPDIAVFEISLGLTGIGDVGVITSLKEDYRIAGGTENASAVKLASINNFDAKSIIVHQSDVNAGGNTYGDEDANLWLAGNNVRFNRLKTLNGDYIDGKLAFSAFDSFFETEHYRNCLGAAFCAVLSLGVPPDVINTNISTVEGRMKLGSLKGRFLIDNSNSGTKLKFLDVITELARQLSGKMILILGEESQYVCEGVDVDELKEVVDNNASEFVEVIIVGDEFKGKIGGKNVFFSDGLDAALEKAISDSKEGFVIISNVKTWR